MYEITLSQESSSPLFYSMPDQRAMNDYIIKRQMEIRALKEEWRLVIESYLKGKNQPFYDKLESCLNKGMLVVNEGGSGGSYSLLDECDQPCFIVKPLDEEIFCLNNRKGFDSPLQIRVRPHIPLYRSCQASAAASAIAKLIGLTEITPITELAIIKNDLFCDLSYPFGDKEKLCAVQIYIEDSEELHSHVQTLIAQGLSDDAIGALIDQTDFEQLLIFIWVCYDNDAHTGNIRTYKKPNGKWGLKKIDNNLTFPEKNRGLTNCLQFFPNANKPLSESSRTLINQLPIAAIVEKLIFYDLKGSVNALKERLSLLQTVIKNPHITLEEINSVLCSAKDG